MRSPKQLFFDYLKRIREQNRAKVPTTQQIEQRFEELVRGTVRDMRPIVADEQSLRQIKRLFGAGIDQMITEHYIYGGDVDTIQVVDGQLTANVNIVPLTAVERITINYRIGQHGLEEI